MKNKTCRAKSFFIILPIVVVFFAIILDPKKYSKAILDGLTLYVNAVLPTLFPMLIFSGLFVALKVADAIGLLLKKPCEILFRTPPMSGYILILAMLSGYPVGAKLIADYYQAGLIDTDTAKRITTFTMTSGPMFIIGTVGGVFFDNTGFGYVILIAHYVGAILNGIIFCRKKVKIPSTPPIPSSTQNNLLYEVFNNGVATIALVGGFITFFYMLTELIIDFGVANIAYKIGGDLFSGVVIGLVEMTRGCQMMSLIKDIDIKKIIALVTAMISFGGLSVTLQATAFLKSAQISLGYYLKIKVAQAIISGIIAYILLIFLEGIFW